MNDEQLIYKILFNADTGIPFSGPRLQEEFNITEEYLFAFVEMLRDENLITYDTIKNHIVYEGHPINIQITEQGKQVKNKIRA